VDDKTIDVIQFFTILYQSLSLSRFLYGHVDFKSV